MELLTKRLLIAERNLDRKQEYITALEAEKDDLLQSINETGKTLDDTQIKLKAAEEKLANSVPFEVMRRFCSNEKCEFSMETVKGKWDCRWHPQDKCPLIPKDGE
jgi:hypothetical protein